MTLRAKVTHRVVLSLCHSDTHPILSAYLKIFKPCGYFLRIKKTQGNLGKFKVTQGRFFDSKSGKPESTKGCTHLI